MIAYEQALQKILDAATPLEAEECAIEEALGRVAAEDIISDVDMPPFDRSAMDGFALRSEEGKKAPVDLRVVEEIPAGSRPTRRIGPGEAAKIMTGAPLPEGADAVQQSEKAIPRKKASIVRILEPARPRQNVCRQGEDIKIGEIVLERGRFIGIAEIGLLGMLGRTKLRVCRIPRVAILATGDEIIPIEEQPAVGQIRNSNSRMLAGASRALGAAPIDLGIAPDRERPLRRLIKEGLACDILLLIGGASVGDYDLVAPALKAEAVTISIEGVAIKPGKPMLFGKRERTLIFGLPGNPVSALVCFWLFVAPASRSLMGFASSNHATIIASLSQGVRKRPTKSYFLPGKLQSAPTPRVTPLKTHGSGDLRHFSSADGLIYLRQDWEVVEEGQLVEVILLDGFPARATVTEERGEVGS